MLSGKKILLGVTGSISAYKSVYLTRLLVQKGAHVKVIMTPAATHFVGPVTFATLSKNPVSINFINDKTTGVWENHVDLGSWADLFLIAPASANTIAKMVYGIADNLLLATWLSNKTNVMLAPAMDHDMFHHFSTQNNLNKLREHDVMVLDTEKGELASGIYGDGRLLEPEKILSEVEFFFQSKIHTEKLKNKNVIVTAGPTFEELDPVRYIGNYSTGKMGFAIAQAFANSGANVHLVHGPVAVNAPVGLTSVRKVKTGDEMLKAVKDIYADADIAIMCAAVADYKPVNKSQTKIKKDDKHLTIEFEKTTDILKELGMAKKNQLLVGFALETNNEVENAQRKLNDKNLDFIVLNSLNDNGAGFAHETNKVTVIDKHNKTINFELMSKKELANQLVNVIAEKI